METRFSNDAARTLGMIGGGGWLLLAVAWQVSAMVDARRGWDGLASGMFFVGLAGLLVGGLALAAMALHRVHDATRPRVKIVGLVLLAIALVVSFIAGWAIPVWTAAYGVAMIAVASSGAVRTPAWIAGTALSVASVVWFTLSALEIGTADVYGDYPVAWQIAWWIAGIGAAIGLVTWTRSLQSEAGVAP